MCLNDGYEFVDESEVPVQVDVEQCDEPSNRIDAQLMVLGDDQTGPQVHIDVLHVDGTDFMPGTCTQSFPVHVLQHGELRIGKRTKSGSPPYRPEIDFYELLKAHAPKPPWPVSRLHTTMLLEDGAPAIRHQPEQSTTWIRHSGSKRIRAIAPNRVTRLEQRDVITFGKPGRRYVRFRITWDY